MPDLVPVPPPSESMLAPVLSYQRQRVSSALRSTLTDPVTVATSVFTAPVIALLQSGVQWQSLILAIVYVLIPLCVVCALHFVITAPTTLDNARLVQLKSLEGCLQDSQAQIASLNGQVEELDQRLNARNLIVAYDGGRHDQKDGPNEKLTRRVIRLQLENASERDITGIKAKAESFQSLDGLVQQVPLRIAHDEHNEKRNGFSLAPGEKEMVDIVEREVDSDFVRLCTYLSSQRVTQEKNFKISVLITAEGQPKQQKRLRIVVDDVQLLRCDPLKE